MDVDIKKLVEAIKKKNCPYCQSNKVAITFGVAECFNCKKSLKVDEMRQEVEKYMRQHGGRLP